MCGRAGGAFRILLRVLCVFSGECCVNGVWLTCRPVCLVRRQWERPPRPPPPIHSGLWEKLLWETGLLSIRVNDLGHSGGTKDYLGQSHFLTSTYPLTMLGLPYSAMHFLVSVFFLVFLSFLCVIVNV